MLLCGRMACNHPHPPARKAWLATGLCSTAPVKAKPDCRPRLEEAHYKYPISCALPIATYPSFNLHVKHTLAHTNSSPLLSLG